MSKPELVEVDYEDVAFGERYYYLEDNGGLRWSYKANHPVRTSPFYRLVVPVEPVELPEGWAPLRDDPPTVYVEVGEYLTREAIEKIVADAPQVFAWMDQQKSP